MAAQIFGLPIEGVDMETAIDAVLKSESPVWLVTANPEILLEAKRNSEYRSTIRKATLRLVDGFGLELACRVKGEKVTRVAGVELSERLLQLANEQGWRVGLIGSSSAVIEKALHDIRSSYPDAMFVGEAGGQVNERGNGDLANEEAAMRLSQVDPHLVLVAFGHPKQEFWIEKHLGDYPSLKAIVGVGGTFDFWAGTAKRAPQWMRSFGLEWLWRLILEPKRFFRILNAVIVFPIQVLLSK
jgi:N-acetylglucosaminyldiphosphoundecaprenol N-acetyl-beta-D-mannosaminyltransferase